MIKKLILAVVVAVWSLTAVAKEFKFGDVKYTVVDDRSVEIKDAKKASGDFLVPSAVRDPKSKMAYNVTAIGEEAFKKAKVTSVTIPNSVKVIGKSAFAECKQLTTVTIPESVDKMGTYVFWRCNKLTRATLPKTMRSIPAGTFGDCSSLTSYDFEGIQEIETDAFRGSGLKSIVIPSTVQEIGETAFAFCNDLAKIEINESNQPLEFDSSVLYVTPLKEVVVGRPIIYSGSDENTPNYANQPFNNNPALKKAKLSGNGLVPLNGCTGLNSVELSNIDLISEKALDFFTNLPDQATITINGEALTQSRESIANYVRTKMEFKRLWAKFNDVAYNHPEDIDNCFRKLEPSEMAANIDIVKKDIYQIIDHYKQKSSMNQSEDHLFSCLINNVLSFIGYDYGKANARLHNWADNDMLRRDLQNDFHKDEYRRMLDAVEFYFKHNNNRNNPYMPAVKLAALCGLEKWAEAAKYYPIAWNAATENGTYMVPPEFDYMCAVINEHGQKVSKPVAKTSNSSARRSSSGSSSTGSSYNNAGAAILLDAAHDIYQYRKAKRELRKEQEKAMNNLIKAASKGKVKKFKLK